MIVFYALFYGLLLCFTRFSGACNAAYMPLFSLFENASFYPGDIYVHGSLVATSSYLYPMLKVFGALPANIYFQFFLFVLVSLAHVWFIFKIGEALFEQLKPVDIGLVTVLMFLYDYPIFMAMSQIVYQHSFSQTAFAMPILAAAFYCFFKDRILAAMFLAAVAGMPLHFKSSWIIAGTFLAYAFFYHKAIGWKKAVAAFFIFMAGVAVMFFMRAQSLGPALSFDQKVELCRAVFARGGDEDVILLNSAANFLKFGFVVFAGIFCARLLGDKWLKRKLYAIYIVSGLVFAFGIAYASFLYKIIPIPEVALLGYPRSMAYTIIISLILMGGTLLGLVYAKDAAPWKKRLAMAGLFVLAFFPNFKPSAAVFAVCAAVCYVPFYRSKRLSERMRFKPFTAWLYAAVILFLLFKAHDSVNKSRQSRSPFFPLTVFSLDRDSYDFQVWAKQHTPLDSVFIVFAPANGSLTHDGGFRQFSGRTMFFGDYNNFHLNYGLYQEHLKREEFFKALIESIVNGDVAGTRQLLAGAPWRIDYIGLPRGFTLEHPQVYENGSYICYRVEKIR